MSIGVMRTAILILGLLAARGGPLETARQKFDLIDKGRVAGGSRMEITAGELNAWVASTMPVGVREPHLTLGNGIATGSAMVDFLKVRQAKGERPGFLMRQLLEGERPVSVTARIRSQEGKAVVDVERVEISGVEIEGRTLDLLIRKFVRPAYPDAKVGEWFALGSGIERLEVQPSVVGVVMKRTR